MAHIKIGIDVGGTFTHAVAIEVAERKLVGKVCVPTTHSAKAGVAQGVIDALQSLLTEASIAIEDIQLIAHSTTQATNALLEGDVAPVGVIGMGRGLEGWRARAQTRFDQLELSPGKVLPVYQRFVDPSKTELTEALADRLIDELVAEGAQVIVASEAFGVDDLTHEHLIVARAREKGLLATAASDISKLYGLRGRSLTAGINASMMPKMLETANLTEQAIREAGIQTPVMVMRSDGGIMDIDEMRKRPILTMLSGPAAGVAAALMYARVSDGIFIEVGGTSSDITVIRNGKPQVKSAQIEGHRLYVQTLDVRTLGIAGGSIPRMKGNQITAVGPRSAHIADLHYPAFSPEADFSQAEPTLIQPRPGDPQDYLKITCPHDDKAYTLTPTEAAYALDLVKVEGHDGEADVEGLNQAFDRIAGHYKQEPKAFATQLLTVSAEKMRPTIQKLLREYKLDADLIQFVGGGGGAMAIVPFAAQHLGFEHTIVEHTEVISAIGAALGLIRDSVERNLINPTNEDLIQLRQEAYESVLGMGATPDSIEVSVEVDTRNKKVVAVATGASDLKNEGQSGKALSDKARLQEAAKAFKQAPDAVELLGESEGLYAYGYHTTKKLMLGLIQRPQLNIRVLDAQGTVKLQINDAEHRNGNLQDVKKILPGMIEELTAYGDAGGLLPDVYVLLGQRIVDLGGVVEVSQMLALLEQEAQQHRDQPVVMLAVAKN